MIVGEFEPELGFHPGELRIGQARVDPAFTTVEPGQPGRRSGSESFTSAHDHGMTVALVMGLGRRVSLTIDHVGGVMVDGRVRHTKPP